MGGVLGIVSGALGAANSDSQGPAPVQSSGGGGGGGGAVEQTLNLVADQATQSPTFDVNNFAQQAAASDPNAGFQAAEQASFGEKFLQQLLAKKLGGSAIGRAIFSGFADDEGKNFSSGVVQQMGSAGTSGGPLQSLLNGLGGATSGLFDSEGK